MIRRRGRAGDAPDHPALVAHVAALERTSLSWERTGISLAALGTIVFKIPDSGPLLQAGGILMISAAIVLVLFVVPLGYRRARAQVLEGGPGARLQGGDTTVAAVLLTTASVVSMAAVFAIVETAFEW